MNHVNRTAATPSTPSARSTSPWLSTLVCSLLAAAACGDPGKPRSATSDANAPASVTAPTTASPATSPSPTAERRQATAPANGYGDQIAWRGLDEGLAEAAKLGRPLMLVVHAGWCPRCRELKQRFFDPSVADASDRLVMVNLDQDQSPEALGHGPDGQYIPRILFFDPQGRLDPALQNPGRGKYKYFYTPQDDLVAIMRQALDRHDQAAKL